MLTVFLSFNILVMLVIASLSVFTQETRFGVENSPVEFGWCFIMSWINAAMGIATSIVILFDQRYINNKT